MSISRVELQWTLGGGGTGITALYGSGPGPVADAAHTFFTSLASRIPAGLVISYSGTGEQLDEVTGVLETLYSGVTPWSVTGTGTGSWAAGTGASVRWLTAGVHGGHRVNGRTFVAPLNSFAYGSDGTLDTPALTDLRNAAAAFVTAATPNFKIWSRPKPARAGAHGTLPAIAGEAFTVTGSLVDDVVTSLRSRRH